MAKSKVYFCDFRTHTGGASLPQKLQKLMRRAGIGDIDFDNKFTAIKMHFGELGNLAFLRPNYAKAVADVVKELGGKPFLTDCNTLYPGSRKNALEHLMCAWENGFSYLSTGCPILIGDGLKGTDEVYVPVEGGEYVQEAKIGHAIMDADVFISLAHFKGHECAGFGGAIKNVGMAAAPGPVRWSSTTAASRWWIRICAGAASCVPASAARAPSLMARTGRPASTTTSVSAVAGASAPATLTPSPTRTGAPTPSLIARWRSTPRRWCPDGPPSM